MKGQARPASPRIAVFTRTVLFREVGAANTRGHPAERGQEPARGALLRRVTPPRTPRGDCWDRASRTRKRSSSS